MKRAYRVLLRLYPADYRAMFEAEMARAFDRVAEKRRDFAKECVGLIAGAGAEWIAKWTTDASLRGRVMPDLRIMRPPGVPKEVWFRSDGCL